MDDDIEDMVGEVKLSESSVATTLWSGEMTDSAGSGRPNSTSSGRQDSLGRATYVIDDDSDASDHPFTSPAPAVPAVQTTATKTTGVQRFAILHEIYTQTSKTIMELATMDTLSANRRNTLETQTSLIAITENKTVEYKVEMSQVGTYTKEGVGYASVQTESSRRLERSIPTDATSKYYASTLKTDDSDSTECESGDSLQCTTAVTATLGTSKRNRAGGDDFLYNTGEVFSSCSDMEDDSLMEPARHKRSPNLNSSNEASDVPKSVDNDVDELYRKLSETIIFTTNDKWHDNLEIRRLGNLTPLTEESNLRSNKNSFHNVTPRPNEAPNDDKDLLFVNRDGMRIKLLPNGAEKQEPEAAEVVRLPPIHKSCPNSPRLNFLFSNGGCKAGVAGGAEKGQLPCLPEGETDSSLDMRSRANHSADLHFVGGDHGSIKSVDDSMHLPPILRQDTVPGGERPRQEGAGGQAQPPLSARSHLSRSHQPDHSDQLFTPISIKQKIKELKYNNMGWPPLRNRPLSTDEMGSTLDTDRLSSIAEKGCEALCTELLHRLKSASWFEVSETLQDIPRSMEKFWGVISEGRTADLIRLVTAQLESPRTLVARAACRTLAHIIKNTNYTKKPDFYEAVSMLLMRTGCFSRAVKAAANVALDDVVCHVEPAHALTALCLHGTQHKSGVVRAAAARLVVVACAVAGGGRAVLRARPPRAATARCLALRAMARLLDDKCADARKFAERLYAMLRPLPNFEAFYLTDVDVETATRQMKKYDALLPARNR